MRCGMSPTIVPQAGRAAIAFMPQPSAPTHRRAALLILRCNNWRFDIGAGRGNIKRRWQRGRMYAARRIGSGLGKFRGLIFFELLHLITGRMRQRFLVIEHRAEITHIKPAAARFAFPKMLSLGQWWSTDTLAHDHPARDRLRHARDLGHFLPSPDLIGISILS